jgi:hypothetical protein
VQFNNYGFDGTATPFDNSGAMNYWNPSGAELLEFLRTGDPKWVWDFALPQSWLQTFSAYLNLGDRDFSNRNGVAVNSGGSGEGHWHRAAYGSDDYTYDLGMQLAYAVRPDVPMRDRFAQTGRTVVNRYSVPQVDEATRDPYINSVDVVRGVIQHFEALANCAEFVPAPRGQECHDRLETLVAELATDNLFGGTFCQGDVMNPTSCGMPQQFMTNAMHWMFFHRVWKNWGDAGGGLLSRALGEIGLVYYTWGAPKLPDGVSLDVDGVWAVLLDCTVSAGVVTGCTVLQNGDGDLLGPNIPHTVAFLLVANEVDPTIGLCDIARAAFDDPDLAARWGEHLGNDAGWWKGSAQMMQLMAFGIGGYDTCQDP